MKFDLFKQIYIEALESESLEHFIGGWQDWMEDYEVGEVADILTRVHSLANSPLKDTRGVSRAEFARRYSIPERTLQDWDLGNRKSPEYVKLLIDFAQFNN